MESHTTKQLLNKPKFYAISVLALLLIRVFINATLPLMDKTEARYAEIARIMAETNHWVTPHIDYGIPFWAKPPLSTWMSAFSMTAFGVNEFAVRLPSLLLSVILILIIGKYAKYQDLPFFLPAFILLTIPEFLLHAGVVSTDMSLCFCVTLPMISFWESIKINQRTVWNYLFFVGIGLGLLAKGPIVLILAVPPILLWLLLFRKHIKIFKTMPWTTGIIIVLILSVPWYYLAEKATPGFLDYFLVGEHFKRFFDSNWSGDKYGFPKSQPLGIIWVFLVVFTLPWIPLVIKNIWQNRLGLKSNKWVVFLILWLLWTPIFFTFSKSLIHPYILPVMVPLALLVVHWWKSVKWQKPYIIMSLVLPFIALILLSISISNGSITYYSKTDKYLLEHVEAETAPIYHFNKNSYSSRFYSKGKIQVVNSKQLDEILQKDVPFFVIISHRDTVYIKNGQNLKLKAIGNNAYKSIYANH